jgi:amino acid transporter
VGEVDSPHRTLPKALFVAVLLVVGSYFVPLLSGIGAFNVVRSQWNDGYFTNVAVSVGGVWLGWWMGASAALSNMGMFEAEMSSDSFQLLGMAERGMLPRCFATRSVHGTPTLGIIASASGVLLLSSLSFQEIIAAENYLYCFGMLLEISAFIWFRIYRPEISRPYRMPLNTVGVVLMCIPPTILLVLVMIFATWKVIIISFATAFVGFAVYPSLGFLKQHNWIQFNTDVEFAAIPDVDDESVNTKLTADASIGLLHEEQC